ncbi:MAG: hypothetical protein ACRC2R_09960, partial [Xenococcaceae cyanobacterium]
RLFREVLLGLGTSPRLSPYGLQLVAQLNPPPLSPSALCPLPSAFFKDAPNFSIANSSHLGLIFEIYLKIFFLI